MTLQGLTVPLDFRQLAGLGPTFHSQMAEFADVFAIDFRKERLNSAKFPLLCGKHTDLATQYRKFPAFFPAAREFCTSKTVNLPTRRRRICGAVRPGRGNGL